MLPAALVLAGAAQLIGGMVPVVIGLIFFMIGFPHGAGDENDGTMRAFSISHIGAYLMAATALAALFLIMPLAGLLMFFALSAWHFARSDVSMADPVRWAIAALSIGGGVLFRPAETTQVLGALAGSEIPPGLAIILAIVGAAGTGLAIWAMLARLKGSGHAFFALAVTAICHPVLAVGCIFLLCHAVPVQTQQVHRYGLDAVRKAVVFPTIIAITGGAAIAVCVWSGWVSLQLASAMAIGVATPHMLTERLDR